MARKLATPAEKLRNYLFDFLESDQIQKNISELRKKYKIPLDGLIFSETEKKLAVQDSIIYFPDGFVKNKSMIDSVSKDLNALTEKFPLKHLGIQSVIRVYFFHNVIMNEVVNNSTKAENMCKIVDSHKDMLEECIDDPTLRNIYLQHFRAENYSFPVSLKINPRASKRDVLRFIEEHWELIEKSLSKYHNRYGKLGKIRSRNPLIRKRDKIILDNEGKTYREIRELLKDNGIPTELIDRIDPGSIGKIRSIGRQRRKEV